MAPIRPTLAALLLYAAAAAGSGSGGVALQARRARAPVESEHSEQPPERLAAEAPAAAAEPATRESAPVRPGAAWAKALALPRRLRHGVVVAVRRSRALLGGAQQGAAAQPGEAGYTEEDDMVVTLISTLFSMVFGMTMVIGVAVLYQHLGLMTPEVDLEAAQETFKDEGFAHGPFECHEDMETMCWSCWCPGIRWSDNMQAVDILKFWLALALFLSIAFLDTFTGGLLIWVLIAGMFAAYRQKLRTKFNMKNDGEDQLKDFGMWCCCACCAIAQEARHIKMAPKKTKTEDPGEAAAAPLAA